MAAFMVYLSALMPMTYAIYCAHQYKAKMYRANFQMTLWQPKHADAK